MNYLSWISPRFKGYVATLNVHRILFERHRACYVIIYPRTILKFACFVKSNVGGSEL